MSNTEFEKTGLPGRSTSFKSATDLTALRLLLIYQGHLIANFRELGLDQAQGDPSAGVLARQVPKEHASAALNTIWGVGQAWLAESGANLVLKKWLAGGFRLVDAITPVEHRANARRYQGEALKALAEAQAADVPPRLTLPTDWISALHGVAALSTALCTTLPDPINACVRLGEIAYSPAAKAAPPSESPTARLRAEWRRKEEIKSSDLAAQEPAVRDLVLAELAAIEFDLDLTAPRGAGEDQDWPGGWTVPSQAGADVTAWRTEAEARKLAAAGTKPEWVATIRTGSGLHVLDASHWGDS